MMKNQPVFLIHAALLNEAKPIIVHFKLRQCETHPFRIFRGGRILLVVSGVGKKNTKEALYCINGLHHPGCFETALNVGTAGCNIKDIPVGALYQTHGRLMGLPVLPLKTVDTPVTSSDSDNPYLVDMEAAYFLETLKSHIPEESLYVLKIVSDHLDDTILKAQDISRIVAHSIPAWESIIDCYTEKMKSVFSQTAYENLDTEDCMIIEESARKYRFTHQELKQIIEMALDFNMWNESGVGLYLDQEFNSGKEAYEFVKDQWTMLKNTPKGYINFKGHSNLPATGGKTFHRTSRHAPGFGRCPVASEKTRCCNLLTLDAVEGCGYDCSYCSIRYFYEDNSIGFDDNFIRKIKSIKIDPRRTYHIGTGQSSDSLMWGNRAGVLEALLDFATEHPNVILELKTKSDNIAYLLNREVPDNVLITWSLNPQIIIENEEHYTASLTQRLDAADRMVKKGHLIGFHFHPMVYYDTWRMDYASLCHTILNRFSHENVVLISLGTLTFTRSVIRKIRERKIKSKILQMPLEDSGGKYSYPVNVKREMFRFLYESFSAWHDYVFFYMCMEDAGLWRDVFGYEYPDNDAFETSMIEKYKEKIHEYYSYR